MEVKCVNYRHFRRGSFGPTDPEHVWGDCLKAKEHAWGGEGMGTTVSFTWGDSSCRHFEPKETSDDSPAPDSQ